jgi:outer membrane protein assembly factor BamB
VPGSVLGMAAAVGTLCVPAEDPFGFRGLSASNGKESWSLRGRYLNVTAVGDEAFIVTGLSAAAALDPKTGQQKWRSSLPTVPWLAGLPTVTLFATDSTTVYATGVSRSSGSPQCYIFAIDALTGERKWAAYFPRTAEISGLTAGDGVVCALSGMDKMIALDARTGARMWTAPGPVPFEGAIAGGVISGLIAGTAGTSGVVAIDVLTGRTLWTTNVGGTVEWPASDGGIVYVPAYNGPEQIGVPGDLVALDARSGKRLWARHFAEGAPLNLRPAGAVVYTGFRSTVMHALDSRTGGTLWTYTMPLAGNDQLSDIVLTPGRVLLASLNGAIFALQA